MTQKRMVEVGFYLNPEIHRLATGWCEKNHFTLEAFCSIAVAHYFLELAAVQHPIQISTSITTKTKGEA